MIFVTIHMPTISVYPASLVLIQTAETCHNNSTTVSFHCPSYCMCTLIDCHNCIHQPLWHTCLPYSSSSHFLVCLLKTVYKSFIHFHTAEPKIYRLKLSLANSFSIHQRKSKCCTNKLTIQRLLTAVSSPDCTISLQLHSGQVSATCMPSVSCNMQILKINTTNRIITVNISNSMTLSNCSLHTKYQFHSMFFVL